MPEASSSGPFRFVGRIIPVDGPDDPEKAIFIDIPRAYIVTEFEDYDHFDGIATWYYTNATEVAMKFATDPETGTAYIIHQGAPPEGYFPPSAPPVAFDF